MEVGIILFYLLLGLTKAELFIFDSQNGSSSHIYKTKVYPLFQEFGIPEGYKASGSLLVLGEEELRIVCNNSKPITQGLLQKAKSSDLVITKRKAGECLSAIFRSSEFDALSLVLFPRTRIVSRFVASYYVAGEFEEWATNGGMKHRNSTLIWGYIEDSFDILTLSNSSEHFSFSLIVDEHPWGKVLNHILTHIVFRGVLGVLYLELSRRCVYYGYIRNLNKRTSTLEQNIILFLNGVTSFVLAIFIFFGLFYIQYYRMARSVSTIMLTQFFFCTISSDYLLANIYERVVEKIDLAKPAKNRRRRYISIAITLVILDIIVLTDIRLSILFSVEVKIFFYPMLGVLVQMYITLKLWYKSYKITTKLREQNAILASTMTETPSSVLKLMMVEANIRRCVKISRISSFTFVFSMVMYFLYFDAISPYVYLFWVSLCNLAKLGNLYAQTEACNPMVNENRKSSSFAWMKRITSASIFTSKHRKVTDDISAASSSKKADSSVLKQSEAS